MNRPVQAGGALTAPSTLFLVQATLWIVGLFGVLRLPWVNDHIVGGLIAFQMTLLGWYGTAPDAAIVVAPSCSGADVAALCLGVTLAYPVAWRRRLWGAAIGGAIVFGVNIVRIATLSASAAFPSTFNLLHFYIWPGALALLVVGYVFAWIRWNARRDLFESAAWSRFCRLMLAGFVLYAATAPWALASASLARVGVWTARSAATVLTALGAPAQTLDRTLITARGGFTVTQECLFTPMIPLVLAALLSLPMPRARRWMWIALTPAFFFVLAVARVLALALPAFIVDRPLLLVHGFYQLVAAVILIGAAAYYAKQRDTDSHQGALSRAMLALAIAVAVGILAGAVWRTGVEAAARAVLSLLRVNVGPLVPAGDQQGALALLPPYQLALTFGLWVALTGGRHRRTLAWGLAALALSQTAFIVLTAAILAEWGRAMHALAIRGWAVAVPSALALVWTLRQRANDGRRFRRGGADDEAAIALPPDVADRYAAGIEYVVDARGCDPALLRSIDQLQRLSNDVVQTLSLRTVAPPIWHRRAADGGVAGMVLLSESHFSIHTYPDAGLAVINLHCCRPRADWPWEPRLTASLGAGRVVVRVFPRGRSRELDEAIP
jgi:S-adenosylmethionine decarboxylase